MSDEFNSSEPLASPKPVTGPLTRSDVARAIGRSVTHVRHLERTGVLHPAINPHTLVRTFDPDEVSRVAAMMLARPAPVRPRKSASARGELEAAALRIFRRGGTWQNVVIRLHVTSEEAIRLWHRSRLTGEQLAQVESNERRARELEERRREAQASQAIEQREHTRRAVEEARTARAKLAAEGARQKLFRSSAQAGGER